MAVTVDFQPSGLVAYAGGVFFSGKDAGDLTGVWVTNGTAGGTREVGGLADAGVVNAGSFGMGARISDDAVAFGGGVLFAGKDTQGKLALWWSDGTAAGTVEIGGAKNAGIADVETLGGLSPQQMTAVGGTVYFNGTDYRHKNTLWKTDGTAAGTIEIGGLYDAGVAGASGDGLQPIAPTALGSKVLFYGADSAGGVGLWVSDGTAAGTVEIGGAKNAGVVGAGANGLENVWLDHTQTAVLGSKVVFVARDGHGSSSLWITDGTAGGTIEIGGLGNAGIPHAAVDTFAPSQLIAYGGKVWFSAMDDDGTTRLWSTDGTAAGTTRLGGSTVPCGFPGNFAVANGLLFFSAFDEATGLGGLWVSDGTLAGTREIGGGGSIGVGGNAGGLLPYDLEAWNGRVHFAGTDTSGRVGLWVSDGTAVGTREIGGVGSAGVASGHASHDFGGTGRSGVLFRNAAGVTYLWTMNGATVAAGATTSVQVGPNWQIRGVGDFDGNGTADLLWGYANAANAADPLNGVTYLSTQDDASATAASGVVQQIGGAWAIAGVGDFTGDGRVDVLYRNATTGQTYLDVMNGAAIDWSASGFTSAQVTDTRWSVAAVADFDGDGRTDVLWRYANSADAADPLNGTLYEWSMNGTTVASSGLLSQQASGNWQVVGTGDFDGDGRADILFRYENAANASDALNGLTYVDFMNGTTVASGAPTGWQVDNGWTVATIGDFDGDGRSDILWQQVATGNTFAWTMNGAAVTAGAFTSAQAGADWTAQNGVLIG